MTLALAYKPVLAQSGFAFVHMMNPTPLVDYNMGMVEAAHAELAPLWSVAAISPIKLSVSDVFEVRISEQQNELLFDALMDSLSAFKGPVHLP